MKKNQKQPGRTLAHLLKDLEPENEKITLEISPEELNILSNFVEKLNLAFKKQTGSK